jgi:hypothetical protein
LSDALRLSRTLIFFLVIFCRKKIVRYLCADYQLNAQPLPQPSSLSC